MRKKRIISLILVCWLMVVALMLTACSGSRLDGTYTAYKDGASVTVEFRSNNTFTMIMFDTIRQNGTYKIEGNKITIEMDVPFMGGHSVRTSSFRKTGSTIYIDDVEYKRQ